MGPGTRHLALDDSWNWWNWRKVLGMGMMAGSLFPFSLLILKPQVTDSFEIYSKPSPWKPSTPMSSTNSTQFSHWALSRNGLRWSFNRLGIKRALTHSLTQKKVFIILSCLCAHADFCVATSMAEVHQRLAEADNQEAQHGPNPHKVLASVFVHKGLEIREHQWVLPDHICHQTLTLHNYRWHLAFIVQTKSTKSDTQKASVQEKQNIFLCWIRKWQQTQLVYMPGAMTPSLPTQHHNTNEDAGDFELPEKIPLILPLKAEPTQRNIVCLHNVAEHEQQLHLA